MEIGDMVDGRCYMVKINSIGNTQAVWLFRYDSGLPCTMSGLTAHSSAMVYTKGGVFSGRVYDSCGRVCMDEQIIEIREANANEIHLFESKLSEWSNHFRNF